MKEYIYWFIVLLTLLYLISRNLRDSVRVLIILCFYYGLATFLGKSIENPYKIILVLMSIYVLQKNGGLTDISKNEGFFLFSFLVFSMSFLYSAYISKDYLTLVFSQYGKYFTPVCLFFTFNRILIKNPAMFLKLKDLFFSLLTIQIWLTFVKILTIGLQESTVGSVAYIGGGAATLIPVFGFILLWLEKQGNINRKDWLYIFLLLFIGFASFKRAIWFIMPATIIAFYFYVEKKIKVVKLLYFLPLIPLIFYIGVRFNPTLNKEGKLGGSFDLQYVMDYSQKYNFGKTSENSDVKLGTGRGGATLLLWDKLINGPSLTDNDYWGVGLTEVYTTTYEQFDEEKFGVNSKGAVSGVFQSYITSGFIGILATLLLLISVIGLIKNPRIRITIAFLLFWDYLFYIGLTLRTQALFVLFCYIITYSNYSYMNSSRKIEESEIR